jgi:hypothetical protein
MYVACTIRADVPRLQLARVARCTASSAPSPVISDATVAIAGAADRP